MKWFFLAMSVFNGVVFTFLSHQVSEVRACVALVLAYVGLGFFESLRQLEAIRENKT